MNFKNLYIYTMGQQQLRSVRGLITWAMMNILNVVCPVAVLCSHLAG